MRTGIGPVNPSYRNVTLVSPRFRFIHLLAVPAIHKPWASRARVSEADTARIFLNGGLLAVCTFLLVYCIKVVDPLRAILLDYSDICVIAGFGALLSSGRGSGGRGGRAPSRAASPKLYLTLAGLLLILWYDPRYHASQLVAQRQAAQEVAARLERGQQGAWQAGGGGAAPLDGAMLPGRAPLSLGEGAAHSTSVEEGRGGGGHLAPRRLLSVAAAAAREDDVPHHIRPAAAGLAAGAAAGHRRRAAAPLPPARGVGAAAAPAPANDRRPPPLPVAAAAPTDARGDDEEEAQPGFRRHLGDEAPVGAPRAAAAGAAAAGAASVRDDEDEGGGADTGWESRDEGDALAATAAAAAATSGGRTGAVGMATALPLAGVVAGTADGDGGANTLSGDDADGPLPVAVPAAAAAATVKKREAALAAARRALQVRAQTVRAILESHTQSSVLLAGVLMCVGSWGNALRRRLSRDLSVSSGLGARKAHAAVIASAALLWLPLALFKSWVLDGPQLLGSGGELHVEAGGAAAPSTLRFLFVALLFGTTVLLFAEYVSEMPLTLFSTGGGGVGSGTAIFAPSSSSSSSSSAPSSAVPSLSLPSLLAGKDGGGVLPLSSGDGVGGGGGGGRGLAASDAATLRSFMLAVGFYASLAATVLYGGDSSYQVTAALWLAAVTYVPGTVALSGADLAPLLRVLTGSDDTLRAITGGLRDLWAAAAPVLGISVGDGSGGGYAVSTPRSYGGDADDGGGGGEDGGDRGFGAIPPTQFARFAALSRKVMAHVMSDPNSRKIFMFLCINVSGEGWGVGRLLTRVRGGGGVHGEGVGLISECATTSHFPPPPCTFSLSFSPPRSPPVRLHVRGDHRGVADQLAGPHLRRGAHVLRQRVTLHRAVRRLHGPMEA